MDEPEPALSFEGAVIYELGEDGMIRTDYDELGVVGPAQWSVPVSGRRRG